MKRLSWYLFSSLAVVLYPNIAQGEDLTTAFQLPPIPAPEPSLPVVEAIASLPIPPTAAAAPIQGIAPQKPLPPPPPRPEIGVSPVVPDPSPEPAVVHNTSESAPTPAPTVARPVELSFGIGAGELVVVTTAPTAAPTPKAATPPANQPDPLDPLFEGGANSLVARVVGSAEGTRTADGQRTRAFYGHRDPGNGVWNLGSFSYQHGAASPEEADEKQLKRLRKQAATLQAKAIQAGVEMTLAERLNGIDLANQSPRAALHRGGYIDRLAESRQLQMQGDEAILWSRTRSFLDPDTQKWNAPGLGNTAHGVTRDQERRMRAIARALDSYQQQAVVQTSPSLPNYPTAEDLAASHLLSLEISH